MKAGTIAALNVTTRAPETARVGLIGGNGHLGTSYAVSPGALTLRGSAEAMFRLFGHEPKLAIQPWKTWAAAQDPAEAATTREHNARSPSWSITKAERLFGDRPRHTSLEAVEDALPVTAIGMG